MDEGATVVVGVTSQSTVWRLAMLGFAVAAWLVGFAILLRLGTWTLFALTGPALAALALWSDAATRALLRPSFRKAGVGLAAGLLMVVLTHAAFAFVAPLLSEARTATARLFELLNVSGFSPAARVGFIVAIASSEEVIFRGALMGPPARRQEGLFHRVDRDDLLRVLALAVAYALAMATLESGLLIVCAFGCAVLWGGLRVATRSLVVPIIAHVVWDLGILVVWPLVQSGG